ncbi:MAG: hypothetical protein A2Y94_07475 [Caldithrix sp. RBG_13_44_9]|nr:MAG: hypothetical protein A2Y94_07475 [Caldithrix sp. RBG_13_44_9]
MRIAIEHFDRLDFYNSVFHNDFFVQFNNEYLQLDLTRIEFIDPFGIMFLKIYLQELLSHQNAVECILNESVVNYLVRMNFQQFFLGNNQLKFHPDLFDIHLKTVTLTDTPIELQEFSVDSDDEVERVVEHLVQIISSRINFYHNIREGLWLSLSESISNVELHSRTGFALVALQTYQTKKGNSILIAIGDDGIGIKKGLKRHGEGLSDQDAIEKALEPRITGRDDRGGTGLTDIRDYIIENNDSLGIRSCEGYLYIKAGQITKGKCSFLPGTQLSFKLNNY